MNVMASSKWVEYASEACGTLLGKAAFCSLIGASMGLYLGIGAGTAAAATLDQTVGPFTVDFLYPNLGTDQNLGIFNFPSTGQTVSVPFGVGMRLNKEGTPGSFIANSNPFELDVTPTAFDIRYLNPNNVGSVGFVPPDIGIIKLTTTKSSLINVVSLQSQTGITLKPGAFLFGSNFFQVELSRQSFIDPGANLNFSASYNGLESPVPEAVPEPSSLLGYITLGGLILGASSVRRIRSRA